MQTLAPMPAFRTSLSFALVSSLAVACVEATPVTASPLPPDQETALRAAIVGSCTVVATQKEGGSKKEAKGLTFTFGADGKAGYNALGIEAKPYTYKVEGRNVLMDGPYKAFRVDEFGGETQRWFVYDLSETYWCKKS